MNDWQTIETAPKDGTTILVWSKRDGTNMARWQEVTEQERYSGWSDGWYDTGEFKVYATHWMHPPQPPEEIE